MQSCWLSSLCFLYFSVSLMQASRYFLELSEWLWLSVWVPCVPPHSPLVLSSDPVSPEADSAAVPSSSRSKGDPKGEELQLSYVRSLYPFMLGADPPHASAAGPLKKIFMKEADALNFFRRRSRRGAKSQDEINGEFSPGLDWGLLATSSWVFVVNFLHLCLMWRAYWHTKLWYHNGSMLYPNW